MLSLMMTDTATTQRITIDVAGTSSVPTTHLESVKIVPVMLPDAQTLARIVNTRQGRGKDGTAVNDFETFTEPHAHTEDSLPVNQLPDIIKGDRLISGGITYIVDGSELQPATRSTKTFLNIKLSRDELE